MNRKEGPKLAPGSVRIIALPNEVYKELKELKGPSEPFYSAVQRLIKFYKDRQD